jgi:predicted esterase
VPPSMPKYSQRCHECELPPRARAEFSDSNAGHFRRTRDWILKEHRAYNMDKRSVIIGGTSAGAALACATVLREQDNVRRLKSHCTCPCR